MRITRISVRVKDRAKSNIRLYLVPDEESLFDNFTKGRFTRPYQEFRKTGLLRDTLINVIGYKEDEIPKVSWSQYAGCSACPCSPGFIVKGSADKPTDFYIYYDIDSLAEPLFVAQEVYDARVSTLAEILKSSIDIDD